MKTQQNIAQNVQENICFSYKSDLDVFQNTWSESSGMRN